MSRRLRQIAATSVFAVLGSGLLPMAASHATTSTSEVYLRPSDGVFAVAGHGWGHGHGMSQWGADGAASKRGMTGPQIAAFYYPNTTQAVLPNSTIRVRVDCDRGVATCSAARLSGAKGLVMVDRGASGATATALPADRSQWRVRVDATGYHLEGLQGSTWTAYPTPETVYTGPLDFGPVAGTSPALVRVNYTPTTTGQVYREYRGVSRVVRAGSSNSVNVVNVLGMEDYLLGVVPRESPSSWPLHALFAQAIAARSYSAYTRAHVAAGKTYDICDTTMCQVYWGAAVGKRAADGSIVRTALEPASTTKAVHCYAAYYPKPTDPAVTPDPCSAYDGPLIRTYKSAPIFAQFSSSNGGWSTKTTSSNPDVQAYLVAQQDPYDGLVASSVHSWSDDVPVSTIEAAYRSAGLGTLKRLKITARDGNGEWGGRVQTVVLEGVDASGAATTVTTTGSSLKDATGLRSSWFKPDNPAPPVVTINGPTSAPRAQPLTLTGTTPAGTASVVVSIRNQGTTTWATRTITPRSDGSWYTRVTPTVNIAYFATVGSTSSGTKSTLVRGTTISGPATAAKGSVVSIGGWAAPGSAVTVCWKRQVATTCTSTMSRTATASGWWSASARLYVDYSYSASAAGASSPTLTTHVS